MLHFILKGIYRFKVLLFRYNDAAIKQLCFIDEKDDFSEQSSRPTATVSKAEIEANRQCKYKLKIAQARELHACRGLDLIRVGAYITLGANLY